MAATTKAPAPTEPAWRRATRHGLFWPVVALAALLLANTAFSPDFLAVGVRDGHLFGAPIDILRNSAPLMLVALGMTLVIATRGIDLSVGAVVAIAGALSLSYIATSPTPGSPVTVLTAICLALGVCLLLGVWNGFLVSVVGIQPIIATLILMTAGRGIAMLITEGQITTVTSAPFKTLGTGFLLGLPVAMLIAYGVFVLVALLTRRTALGMLVESVGINPAASRLAGVKARTIVWTVFALSGLFSGLAGLILASNVMAADANNAGLFIELDAILAVVIGGTSLQGGKFSLSGTFVGVLIITTLTLTVTIVGISPLVTPLFKALVVIVVTLLQSPRIRATFAARARRRAARPEEVAV
ncbi:ABC transporter permease [Isoptericola dokdonensis]|jgi:ribose/xylose/arabinose/galactoside ABC-type transport system permease subunit|uniref:Inner membrane ABC transporter permease protein YtfT n=1 Tax=Isoptericola dokdonensis DS-3 TaxID=1300344 RepID=A0A161I6G2_9MICO|nr:ABC transporter permease [Isoptericola dokdonensis]ANC31018.1 Inner membrane ABC transporter permease protein YtfT [Isoptericola dokdonensis DS-3]